MQLSVKNLEQFIKKHERFVLTAHVDPDADATGAEFAMLRLLQRLGKKAVIFNHNLPDSKYCFYDSEGSFHSLETEGLPPDLAPFALIILDTGDLNHIGLAHDLLYKKSLEAFIVDHHSIGMLPDCGLLIDETASATCQIIYDFYQHMAMEPELPEAQGLYTGIVFDSGGFIYPKTSPRTFEVARNLVLLGVKPKEIHSNLYEQIPASRMRLLAKVQSTMEIHFMDQIALQSMTMAMVQESLATYNDSESFVNYPLKCHSIKVSVLFKETEQRKIKCSLRSKGGIDVAAISLPYGGGGHRNAAGFLWNGTLDQIRLKLLESLEIAILEDSKTL